MFANGKNVAIELRWKAQNKLQCKPITLRKILFLNEISFLCIAKFLLDGFCEFNGKFFRQTLEIPVIGTEFGDLESCENFFW